MSLPRIRRYPPGTDFIGFGDPAPVTPELVHVTAGDGVTSKAVLYSRGTEKSVVCVMHPRADMTRHYAIPYILGKGFAFFAQVGRFPGDDSTAATIHEPLVADVGAGMGFLRSRGFKSVIALGNSGAASLYCLYHAQATTAAPARLTTTAAGDPFDLNQFDLPTVDGCIFLGAHLGAGKTLEGEIDPSVTDENDPLSCDPELDIYNPDNGFREPAQSSRYSAEFLAKYRVAQKTRAARLDAIAWSLISDQRFYEERSGTPEFDELEPATRSFMTRRAVKGRFMQIHRLDANPANVDLSILPSDRGYGSLMSVRPDISNYSAMATKVLSPRAWLSSWSGRYSRASLLANLPAVRMPTLVVAYSGDNALHPGVAELIYRETPAADKEFATVVGDHFGFPVPSKPNQGGRDAGMKVLTDWLLARFPAG
jgi:hypothetical protein